MLLAILRGLYNQQNVNIDHRVKRTHNIMINLWESAYTQQAVVHANER